MNRCQNLPLLKLAAVAKATLFIGLKYFFLTNQIKEDLILILYLIRAYERYNTRLRRVATGCREEEKSTEQSKRKKWKLSIIFYNSWN